MWLNHAKEILNIYSTISVQKAPLFAAETISFPKCFLQTCVRSSPCTVEPRNNMWALLAIKWRFCHSFRTDGDSVNTYVSAELRVVSFESFFKRARILFANWINFGYNGDPRERNGSRPDGQRAFRYMSDCSAIYLYNLYLLLLVLFVLFLVLFRLCIFILICFVCTSVRTTATEWQVNCI